VIAASSACAGNGNRASSSGESQDVEADVAVDDIEPAARPHLVAKAQGTTIQLQGYM
jgi:hypothetical protein